MLDLILHNGLIFDGLGSAPQRASLAVEQGRVVAISDRIDTPAREAIDAAGMWITPGFLDIHTHYDLEVEIAPALLE
ncbi:MAG TPA: D-aminoacylase, partial [Acidobacteriota bacterium]|nr:D-aminoacylase [Acidobacteriota bacterium]